jgi:Tfp pilus assembly protein PilF
MLALSLEYRHKFNAFLNAVANGSASVMALEQTYGKPLAAIEKDLQAYIRGDRFSGVAIPAKLASEKAPFLAEPASPFDVKLALADLGSQPGKQNETEERFKELTRDNPERPEPWAGLAYLAWSRGKMEDTEQNFAKAYSLGARSPRLLWDYGRLAEHDHPQEAIKAFRELLTEQPERTDVRMELAAAQLASHQSADALATLAPVKKISPQDAPPLFTLLAYAQLDAGQRDKAGDSVARLAEYAVTSADRDRADQLKRYLDQPNLPSLSASNVTEGGRPRLVRRTAAGFEEEEVAAPPLSAAGLFVELICNGQRATMVLETDQGRKRFLIEEPTKVNLVAVDGVRVQDFQCGPQKPAKIKVEYRLAEGGQNLEGLVTGIYFWP